MAYADLNTIHNPSTGVAPPATWGDQVRDNFVYFNDMLPNGTGAGTTFTPTINQSVTVSKTTNFSEYYRMGKWIWWNFDFSFTSSGTSGQIIIMTLPVVAFSSTAVQGGFNFLDSGSTTYTGRILPSTASQVAFQADQQNNLFGTVTFLQIVSGDRLYGNLMMRAA